MGIQLQTSSNSLSENVGQLGQTVSEICHCIVKQSSLTFQQLNVISLEQEVEFAKTFKKLNWFFASPMLKNHAHQNI